VSELFNVLTGYSRQREYRTLLVAPFMLRERVAGLIEREIAHAQAGRGGRIILKLNAVIDPRMIDLLYRASQAGVQIDMIVRGICGLRPGVPGLSDNIRVRSIVGRFLEHTRIYYFANGSDPQIYLGSADLMQRNLDRRVETLFPVQEPHLMARIVDVLNVYLRDNMRARLLLPDGSYIRTLPAYGEDPIDSQMALITRHDVISD
jgi:polyphosphate kinase